MTALRLYRGIAVPTTSVGETISLITENGLTEGPSFWKMEQNWGLPIDALVNKVDLSTSDTQPESAFRPAICASGTVEGASYYAWRHNRNRRDDTPILVEFDAQLDQVVVDGRDFLFTTFQFSEPEKAKSAVEQLFGEKVLTYAEAAWASEDQDRRIALCDLATMDVDVVKAHYANRMVIGGRHGTIFANSFTVALPVQPEAIVRVWSPDSEPKLPIPSVNVSDIFGARP
jgi:hypothetical protein